MMKGGDCFYRAVSGDTGYGVLFRAEKKLGNELQAKSLVTGAG